MKEKQLINADLEGILGSLKECGEVKKQPFRSKVAFNIGTIETELQGLYGSIAEPVGMEEYKTKEKELVNTYAVKFEKNQPVYGEDKAAFNKELKALKIQYADILKQYNEVMQEFRKEVLSLPIEIKLRYIVETELPNDLSVSQEAGLFKIIHYKEEKEEQDAPVRNKPVKRKK